MVLEVTELVRSQRVREIIVGRYEWVLHKTWISAFNGIASKGLENWKDYIPSDDRVRLALGDDSLRVTFFSPLGADRAAPPVGARGESERAPGEKQILLAMRAADLPSECGLDWVFRAGRISALLDQGSASDEEIKHLMHEFGAFVVYEHIPVSKLRIQTVGCAPDDPGRWPLLSAERAEEVTLL